MPSRDRSRAGAGGEAVRGRGLGAAHRGSQEEGRHPPQAHYPNDAQRAERSSRRLDERLRHRHGPVLPHPARGSVESDLARSRPVRPEQGPRMPGLVRGPRGARVLPGRGAHDVPPAEQPHRGPSGAGYDARRSLAAIEEAHRTRGRPTAVSARTVKGKGVSFMENKIKYHGAATSDDELKLALAELEAMEAAF